MLGSKIPVIKQWHLLIIIISPMIISLLTSICIKEEGFYKEYIETKTNKIKSRHFYSWEPFIKMYKISYKSCNSRNNFVYDKYSIL